VKQHDNEQRYQHQFEQQCFHFSRRPANAIFMAMSKEEKTHQLQQLRPVMVSSE
jgi:hypothetical protein